MKIIQVLNTIISNHNKISNVIQSETEYFFVYDNKYNWSINKSKGDSEYYVHFYPDGKFKIEELAIISDWSNFNYVTFSTNELKSKEAHETFSELYQVVASKAHGLDNIFDDIIKSGNT